MVQGYKQGRNEKAIKLDEKYCNRNLTAFIFGAIGSKIPSGGLDQCLLPKTRSIEIRFIRWNMIVEPRGYLNQY